MLCCVATKLKYRIVKMYKVWIKNKSQLSIYYKLTSISQKISANPNTRESFIQFHNFRQLFLILTSIIIFGSFAK